MFFDFYGAPEAIRTPDLCLRRATLYPAELRVRLGNLGYQNLREPNAIPLYVILFKIAKSFLSMFKKNAAEFAFKT